MISSACALADVTVRGARRSSTNHVPMRFVPPATATSETAYPSPVRTAAALPAANRVRRFAWEMIKRIVPRGTARQATALGAVVAAGGALVAAGGAEAVVASRPPPQPATPATARTMTTASAPRPPAADATIRLTHSLPRNWNAASVRLGRRPRTAWIRHVGRSDLAARPRTFAPLSPPPCALVEISVQKRRKGGTKHAVTAIGHRDSAPRSAAPGDRWRDSGARLYVGVIAAGSLITLLVSVLPFVHLAYRAPAAHIAIDTAGAVVCTLAAYLVLERLYRSALLADLLLFVALAVFAAANLFLSVVPALAGGDSGAVATWGVLGGRLIGAVLLAAAAFSGGRLLRAPRRRARAVLAGTALAVALLVVLVSALGDRLPAAIDRTLSPESSGRPRIVGNAVLLTGQVVAMLLFAAAAVAFARTAIRRRDELVRWVAAGTILAAFARLNYFLFPSIYTEFVYTGDGFRLAFDLALLVGGLREIRAYQRGLAERSVLEERRRIARDLHDGLAQDLAFITAQTRALGRAPDAPPASSAWPAPPSAPSTTHGRRSRR